MLYGSGHASMGSRGIKRPAAWSRAEEVRTGLHRNIVARALTRDGDAPDIDTCTRSVS